MTLLLLGLALFFAVHLVPALPPLKRVLVARLGAGGYRGLFSLVALAGLLLVVIGYGRAPTLSVYTPPAWGHYVAIPLMWVALILFPAAHMRSNIKRFTRHPMLWGTVLWAAAHLLVRGDQASLWLFGGFAVYALVAMASANARGARLVSQKHPLKRDLIVVAAGSTAFIVLALAHPWLFGVAVIAR